MVNTNRAEKGGNAHLTLNWNLLLFLSCFLVCLFLFWSFQHPYKNFAQHSSRELPFHKENHNTTHCVIHIKQQHKNTENVHAFSLTPPSPQPSFLTKTRQAMLLTQLSFKCKKSEEEKKEHYLHS